jgi:formylglycine-generating enzyme required for sulfatase activity
MKTKIKKVKIMVTVFTLLISTTVSAQKPTIEWADIPEGTFMMGSPINEEGKYITYMDYKTGEWIILDYEFQHPVTLSAFKMSKYEITIEQFKAFVDSTGYITDADKGTGGYSGSTCPTNIPPGTGLMYEKKAGVNWKCNENGDPRPETEYNHPVIHVSWNDAVAFAEWMGCRLPTDAEWEYACRAGTTGPFNTGDNITTSQANYNGNHPYNNNEKGEDRNRTTPVGSFAPNAWGLYDMHGNVLEYCSDFRDRKYYKSSPTTNPKGPATGQYRVGRSGSYNSSAESIRSAGGFSVGQSDRSDSYGIRLVSDK